LHGGCSVFQKEHVYACIFQGLNFMVCWSYSSVSAQFTFAIFTSYFSRL